MEPFNTSTPNSPNALVVPVSKGTRFANALIDGIVIGIASNVLSYTVLSNVPMPGLSLLLSLAIQFLYYYLQERNGGQTLGKRLTNTKAVMADGSPLTDEAARTRNLWRLIPLVDALSFLFSDLGWHDKYSNTRVVATK